MTRVPVLLSFLAVVLLLGSVEADARAGGGMSFGSRGMRTYSPPPATATAPSSAAPIQRSMTPSEPSSISRPAGGFFNRPGFLGGLAGGFLGAGLFGLLFGGGLFGGLAGFGSIFGLLLQIFLIALIGRWIWGWVQRRHTPAYAGAPLFRAATANPGERHVPGGTQRGEAAGADGNDARLGPADFETFERRLGQIQVAYGAEDLNALRSLVTPEMLSYFAEDLAGNASRGIVNHLSEVKLLQGDLAEAWREGGIEYASVAMRFELIDVTVDRATGRVVEGDPATPTQAREVWTFMRSAPGDWLLSAIQQA